MRYRIGSWRRRWRNRLAGRVDEAYADPQTDAQEIAPFDPPAPGARDYLFFGVIDWHFRHQRPQQLALALARGGRRVFYVSVNFIDAGEPGFSVERLDPQLPLYQIFLRVRGPLSVYAMQADAAQLAQLRASLRALWLHGGIGSAVSVIQHPFWHPVAGFFPTARTVYDCMDHHAGFGNTADGHAGLERQLFALSDLTVVTSAALEEQARPLARRVELIRNAGEYEHFNAAIALRAASDAVAGAPRLRPVIGYYGAIAEWFDLELIDRLASAFPDCDFQLIGDDTAHARRALRERANVLLPGEKPYAELPRWLAAFDVCLIPFRVNALTLATNPVKVYEYLSAGKPVVGTDLPELRSLGELVYRADTHEAFVDAVRLALAERADPQADALRERRMAFAREQTWQHRAAAFELAAEDSTHEPAVSVVVVAYNQWPLTRRCLESLEACSDGVPTELIVVDNASADETPERLREWEQESPARRIAVLNPDNLGFAAGVNAGMAKATGEYLVVLNNDTIVSPGWARGLRRHLERDPGLGLLCPVTNNIGNEAQVALSGTTPAEVFESARRYTLGRTGQLLALQVAAFFCVMIPRAVWERIGPMDERFFPGYFEDDDYCLRLQEAGLHVGCAEDVFVFHELSASFNAESHARRQQIFERNRKLFEEKWGPWKPHTYRRESLPG
jgi:GT2 family glycosyltransferase/glycosyltransferase involved in cell wall biosynthesis